MRIINKTIQINISDCGNKCDNSCKFLLSDNKRAYCVIFDKMIGREKNRPIECIRIIGEKNDQAF